MKVNHSVTKAFMNVKTKKNYSETSHHNEVSRESIDFFLFYIVLKMFTFIIIILVIIKDITG